MFYSSIKKDVLAATRKMLRPAIRILVRNGVNHAELSQICKNIFVEVCAEDFGIRGRPTNSARISLLTGIDRKEVTKLRNESKSNSSSDKLVNTQNKLSRVLTAWHQDEKYLDKITGSPLTLPYEDGCGNPSFSLIAKEYGGDNPTRALLKELLNSQSLEEVNPNFYLPLSRIYIPNSTEPKALLRASDVSNELLQTIFHNLYVAPTEKRQQPRFERRVSNNLVALEHADAFSDFINKEGQALLDRIDLWLSAHECAPEDLTQKKVIRLGLGTYLIQGEPQTTAPTDNTK